MLGTCNVVLGKDSMYESKRRLIFFGTNKGTTVPIFGAVAVNLQVYGNTPGNQEIITCTMPFSANVL